MNNITLAKKFVPLLDETYRLASLTSVLDGNPDLIRQGANWGELIVPIMNLQGLGDYDRSSGYVEGDVTLTYETIACNYDRARMFNVDTVDDLESAGPGAGCGPACLLRQQGWCYKGVRHFVHRRGRGDCPAHRRHADGRGRGSSGQSVPVYYPHPPRIGAGYGHYQEPRGA